MQGTFRCARGSFTVHSTPQRKKCYSFACSQLTRRRLRAMRTTLFLIYIIYIFSFTNVFCCLMSANDENISDYAAFRADNKLIFHCPQMSAKYTVRNVCSHYNHICHILVEINTLFFSLLLAAKKRRISSHFLP